MVSTYPGEFLGERILNLYKVVEALFASRTVDQVKPMLRDLGVPSDVGDMVASVIFVRDQLDSGHVALHALEPHEYEVVHRFAERAEDTVAWLLIKTVEGVADGRFKLKASKSSNRDRLIAELEKRDDLVAKPFELPDVVRVKRGK